jgi:hypothetical protein
MRHGVTVPFCDLRCLLRHHLRFARQQTSSEKNGKATPSTAPAKCFADLFDERTIRAVHEDNHVDSYEAALNAADTGRVGAGKAFHKLMKAAGRAYDIRMGADVRAPRNSFLHRELLDLAKALDLTNTQTMGLRNFSKICVRVAEGMMRKRLENCGRGSRSRADRRFEAAFCCKMRRDNFLSRGCAHRAPPQIDTSVATGKHHIWVSSCRSLPQGQESPSSSL